MIWRRDGGKGGIGTGLAAGAAARNGRCWSRTGSRLAGWLTLVAIATQSCLIILGILSAGPRLDASGLPPLSLSLCRAVEEGARTPGPTPPGEEPGPSGPLFCPICLLAAGQGFALPVAEVMPPEPVRDGGQLPMVVWREIDRGRPIERPRSRAPPPHIGRTV